MAIRLNRHEKRKRIRKITMYETGKRDSIKMRVLFVCICQLVSLGLTDDQDGRPEGQSDPGV